MADDASATGIVRPYEGEVRFAARLVDFTLVGFALWSALQYHGEPWRNAETVAVVVSCFLLYLCAHGTGLYRLPRGAKVTEETRTIWSTWALTFLLLVFVAFLTKTSERYSRAVVLSWAASAPATLTAWHLGLGVLTRELRARGYNTRKAAIVGAGRLGHALARRIGAAPWMGVRVVGLYDDRRRDRGPERPLGAPLRGSFDELIAAARSGQVELVYIALPLRAEPRTGDLIRRLSDTTASVYLAYDLRYFDLLRTEWFKIGDIPVMSVVENPFRGVEGLLKRVEDVVLGSMIVLLISVPMLVVALCVKLSSPGPVLFRQRRYGLNGEEIRILKFRTMTVCEDGDVVRQVEKNDRRVTRLGAFLRRTSLDELPQFLQVLTGTMSIVGPRPHAVAHNETYRSRIAGYMLRHKVKPGITGWAQVHGWRGETDTLDKMEKRVAYDLDYIRRWSLGLDLRIIAMTLRQVVGHRNAY